MISVELKVKHNVIKARVRGVRTATADGTWKTARTILAEAHRRVRRDPEHATDEGVSIADSLAIRETKTSDEQNLVLQVGSFGAHNDRPVARWHETGTSVTHSHPFLHPAANFGRREYKKDLESAIKRECDKNG